MTGYETVEYEENDGVAEISLDRPDVLNAFNDELVEDLIQALETAKTADSVYVVTLTGNGRSFCAGVDTDETLGPASERDRLYNEIRLTKVHRVPKLLRGMEKPTIAAINGPCIGGGVGFALACDFRIMSEDAFLRDQHVNLGIPAGGTEAWLLPKLIGESKAKEFIFTSRDIEPEEAAESDLVVEVTEPGQAMTAARDLAFELRDKPAQGLRSTKRMFNSNFSSLEEASEVGKELHWETLHDSEHKEALEAVREGREPEFDRRY